MIVPSRRTLGAAALIAAGIGAFLVPFLLHSPSTQSTSPTPTTPGNGGKNPTTPSGSSGGDNSGNGGSFGEAKSQDPNVHHKGNGKDNANAFGPWIRKWSIREKKLQHSLSTTLTGSRAVFKNY